MILKKRLIIKLKGNIENLDFGIAEKDELDEIFKLRYQEYSRKEYIDPNKFEDGLEKDEYDFDKNTIYFIIRWRDKVVGTVRLIKNNVLPTEKAFEFSKDEFIENNKNSKVEFGRFIIVPLDKERKTFLPRGLAMVIIFKVLLDYCKDNNIVGGYSFVKSSLYKKMKRLNMPIKDFSNYTQIYSKEGVLYKYFSQQKDPVIPIIFYVSNFDNYFSKILGNQKMFKQDGINIYFLDNLYTKIISFVLRLK